MIGIAPKKDPRIFPIPRAIISWVVSVRLPQAWIVKTRKVRCCEIMHLFSYVAILIFTECLGYSNLLQYDKVWMAESKRRVGVHIEAQSCSFQLSNTIKMLWNEKSNNKQRTRLIAKRDWHHIGLEVETWLSAKSWCAHWSTVLFIPAVKYNKDVMKCKTKHNKQRTKNLRIIVRRDWHHMEVETWLSQSEDFMCTLKHSLGHSSCEIK